MILTRHTALIRLFQLNVHPDPESYSTSQEKPIPLGILPGKRRWKFKERSQTHSPFLLLPANVVSAQVESLLQRRARERFSLV
jgi:hypothetical protein